MYKEEDYFIKEVLIAVQCNAPIGFDCATLEFNDIKLEFSTVIIGDIPVMEVKLYENKEIEYWRVTPIEDSVKSYEDWSKGE